MVKWEISRGKFRGWVEMDFTYFEMVKFANCTNLVKRGGKKTGKVREREMRAKIKKFNENQIENRNAS